MLGADGETRASALHWLCAVGVRGVGANSVTRPFSPHLKRRDLLGQFGAICSVKNAPPCENCTHLFFFFAFAVTTFTLLVSRRHLLVVAVASGLSEDSAILVRRKNGMKAIRFSRERQSCCMRRSVWILRSFPTPGSWTPYGCCLFSASLFTGRRCDFPFLFPILPSCHISHV